MMRQRWLPAIVVLGVSGAAGAAAAAEKAVTMAQVTAAPADRQLSYTFALQQVRAGRLDQAAVALKQVLQIAPDWDAARLFYGTVLFRLNDLEGARTELTAIAHRPITEAQQEEVARYLALIEARTGEVHEAAFVPPSPAQAGIASLLALGAERKGSSGSSRETRIDGAFASSEIARQDQAIGGGHGSFLFLGEAGDPAAEDPRRGADLYAADLSGIQPTVSLGKVRLAQDVVRAAFGPGLPQGLRWDRATSFEGSSTPGGESGSNARPLLAAAPERLNPVAGSVTASAPANAGLAPIPRARPEPPPGLAASGKASSEF